MKRLNNNAGRHATPYWQT